MRLQSWHDIPSMSNIIGQTIGGRYQVKRLVANGGMAAVYVALDTRLDREVALKIVHQHLDDSARARFVSEAKIAARLTHANLVNVFDQGQDDGLAWLAMEYVPGITLRDVIDKFGALNADRALELFEPVLAGLASAHEAGILHRDLKPENVLLSNDGRIKLSDWGLAREVDQRTATESLIGTVAYVSPELVLRGSADARSDVYAAGVLLFELVTGKQPFTGEAAMQVAYQHANSVVPAPSSVNPQVPPLIDELVLWATAREPEHRPRNAGELLQVVSRARNELHNTGQLAEATRSASSARQAATQRIATSTASTDATTVLSPVGATERISPESAQVSDLPSFIGGLDSTTNAFGAGNSATERIGSQATERISGAATERIGFDPEHPEELHPLELLEKRGLLAKILTLSAVLVLLGSGVGWFFSAGPGAFKTVPIVAGQDQSSAEATLQAIHLDYSVSTINDKDVAAGEVIRTEPAAGQLAFGKVKLIVSLGPKQLKVPDLTGQNLVDATATLVKAGLERGSITSWFDSAALGTVYDYTGKDGAVILDGTKIDLKISLGPIPIVSGLDASVAKTALQAVGLVVTDTTDEYSETVAKGKVISIQTAQGQPIGKGSSATLIVSKGSAMVTMPKVVGETILAAKTLLESLGIRVVVNTSALQSNWGIVKVRQASANPGTRIDVTKTSVTITSK